MSALLHIEDPRRPRGRAIGIDLGTTNSLVAYADERGVQVLPVDVGGARLLPSVVHYAADGSVVVGRAAAERAGTSPADTIRSVKRLMGRSLADVADRQAHRFVDGRGVIRMEVAGGHPVTPIEVSAEILRHLKRRAESHFSERVERAVITVPAYFDEAQRQATGAAATLAGLSVLRLLNEPTAAALAYGLETGAQGNYAIFDLGGGTFDVSILELSGQVFHVKAVGGDTRLGGDDFDAAIVEGVLGASAAAELAPGPRALALAEARRAKEALSSAEAADVRLGGVAARVERTQFEAWIEPLLQRAGATVRRALKDAGVAGPDLRGVVMVGGSTRVPAVRALAERLFGQRPITDLDPDQVVAIGAARQAALLTGADTATDAVLLDVIPLSLGLESVGGVVERIVGRNTTVPTRQAQIFTTFEDGQTGMDLHVVQGERELAADCRSLARFRLSGIPPGPASSARVEVTFDVDANGLLTVTARETRTGVVQRVQVSPSQGLTDEEVEAMLLASVEHAEEDLRGRALAEALVGARQLVAAVEKQLAAYGRLASAEERAAMERALAVARAAIATNADAAAVRDATSALDAASAPFAQRLMDSVLGATAVGHRVDEF